MNKKQLDVVMTHLRKPLTILIAAAVLCVGLNLTLFSMKWLPLAARQYSLDNQWKRVDEQKTTLERAPIPAKMQKTDFASLISQVPVDAETSRFLISLRELEAKTGITLSAINLAERSGPVKDDISVLTNGAIQLQPNGTNGGRQAGSAPLTGSVPQTSPSPAAVGNEQSSGGTATKEEMPFATTNLSLQLKGTYGELINFLTQLYQLDRIVNIKTWMLQTSLGTTSGTSAMDAINSVTSGSKREQQPASTEPPIVTMSLTVALYYAKQYAGKAPELPALSVKQPANRDDPTMSDESFYELLKPKQTNAAKP